MHQGSCLCGSITYKIESDLKTVVNCHCSFCRKAHGGVFTPLLFISLSHLSIITGKYFLKSHHVDNINADRYFCSECGTRLYNALPSLNRASIVVATLNDVEEIRPIAHLNTESKFSWFQISDGLPQFISAPSPTEFRQLLNN